jgi:hypothetical protein
MHSRNVLLIRENMTGPGRGFKGRIAVFNMPLHPVGARAIPRSAVGGRADHAGHPGTSV